VTTYTIGIVRVDGVQVGVIQELSTGLTIIRYDDGTFETLG
jgi:L-aminopeptidase/D-esterase-like protein